MFGLVKHVLRNEKHRCIEVMRSLGKQRQNHFATCRRGHQVVQYNDPVLISISGCRRQARKVFIGQRVMKLYDRYQFLHVIVSGLPPFVEPVNLDRDLLKHRLVLLQYLGKVSGLEAGTGSRQNEGIRREKFERHDDSLSRVTKEHSVINLQIT